MGDGRAEEMRFVHFALTSFISAYLAMGAMAPAAKAASADKDTGTPYTTKLGEFVLWQHPDALADIGAKCVRMIRHEPTVRHWRENPAAKNEYIEGLKAVKEKNPDIEIVVSLRWPSRVMERPDVVTGAPRRDRIPEGEDRTEALELLDWFLTECGPHFDWYQLQNEPVRGPGEYEREFKEKDQKTKITDDVAQRTGCESAGIIGHIAIFYRPHKDIEKRKIKVPEKRSP